MKSFPEPTGLRAEGMCVALVAARFNDDVVAPMLECAHGTLVEAGANAEDIVTVRVPGAYELPLAAKWLADSGIYDGIVALGAVIRGETPHFDYVCTEAARGLNEVALTHQIPVGFGVITADNAGQAQARAGGDVGNKGEEATLAVIEMITLARTHRRGRTAT